jgi:hypothetical protein
MSTIKGLSVKNILKLIGVVLVVLLVGCGGGGGSAGTSSAGSASVPSAPAVATPLFTSAPDVLTLGVGAAQEFSIGGGVAPYTAVSNNVAVGISGVKDQRLTIGGVSSGNSEITVRDSLGASIKISLIVSNSDSRPLFTTSASDIVVASGNTNTQTYTVGGGAAPYSATSSNATVVSVSLVGDSLKVTGLAAGLASIVILDKLGARLTIAVTVPTVSNPALFTTAPAAVTVAVASAPSYAVGGGTGPYTATSSNTSIATVSLSGSNLTISGVASGNANIVVRDSTGAVVTVAVTVPAAGTLALFTTAPSAVTIAIGAKPEYSVGGGTGPYTSTSNNASIATTTLRDNNLTITGVAVGSAIISVRDSAGTVVNVNASIGTAPLVITPNSATGIIDDTLVATITGGTAPFRASVGNTLIASALVTGVSGNQLEIKLKQVGTTVVTVLDANNQSIPYNLTVNAATPGIRLSPSQLTISELDNSPINLTVYGAAGVDAAGANVFSSDTSKLPASMDKTTVTLPKPAEGKDRCIPGTAPTSPDLNVTITVVDSTRASGSAIVTIKNSVSVCPAP